MFSRLTFRLRAWLLHQALWVVWLLRDGLWTKFEHGFHDSTSLKDVWRISVGIICARANGWIEESDGFFRLTEDGRQRSYRLRGQILDIRI